jgi:hypothetical protein
MNSEAGYRGGCAVGFHSRASFCASAICAGVMHRAILSRLFELAAKHILQEEMAAAFEALLPGAPTTGLVDAHSGLTWAAAKG